MVEGKVAGIVSEYEVAFNVGASDGVQLGDFAVILRSLEVNDPDSGEVLGYVRRPLIRFRITEVDEDFCVGETYEVVRREGIDALVASPSERSGRRRVTASQNEADWRRTLIRIGAPVQISDEEPSA